MLNKTVEVRNSTGLHARPAACLAKAAKKYSCKVTLHYEGNDINATSMMNIMRAGIKGGKTVEIRCDGDDELAHRPLHTQSCQHDEADGKEHTGVVHQQS